MSVSIMPSMVVQRHKNGQLFIYNDYEILRRLPLPPTLLARACGAVPALDAWLRSAGRCIHHRPVAWSVVAGGPTRNRTQEKERPPRFLGNPCTRVPRSSTPMGVARPCLERSDHCGLPTNLRRRPPPHAPLRGSITRPTCVLSTLHDEGHPIAMQDSLPACWLDVSWAGLAPAGFQSRISRGSPATSFPIEPGLPGAQIMYAKPSSLLDSQAPKVLVAEYGLLLLGTKDWSARTTEGNCNRLPIIVAVCYSALLLARRLLSCCEIL
jgi:hypothetical protein